MRAVRFSTLVLVLTFAGVSTAAEPTESAATEGNSHQGHQMPAGEKHGDHQMTLGPEGSVMNSNRSELPRDCLEISGEREIIVYAGVEFAEKFPGTTFGMSQHEYFVEPCSLVTITFINNDQVRHQWMIHGLPKYLYKQGMFHLEAAGGHRQTGSFIVPSDDRTYLVHCDVPQHMEKGMKGQLKVGRGDGDLWSVPGVTEGLYRDSYTPRFSRVWLVMSIAAGVVIIGVFYGVWGRKRAR